MLKWLGRLVFLAILAGVAAAATFIWFYTQLDAPGPAAQQTIVVVAKGTRTEAIGEQLAQAGVVSSGVAFEAGVYASGAGALKAGEYAFPAHASLDDILDMMRKGQVVVHKLTLAEGLTVPQFLTILRDAQGLSGNPPAPPPAEGSLLPQTYQYLLGDARDQVVNRMRRAMTAMIDELWANRAPNLPLTDAKSAVTLASIVERETADPQERPHVAAVFENRLRQGIKLESDPTVIFAASKGTGVLGHSITRDELTSPDPYNTYANAGLPPGPICNPGQASLEAVLHPAASDDLYFVADGTGRHVFAKTLADHQKNVARWREVEKARAAPTSSTGPATPLTR